MRDLKKSFSGKYQYLNYKIIPNRDERSYDSENIQLMTQNRKMAKVKKLFLDST